MTIPIATAPTSFSVEEISSVRRDNLRRFLQKNGGPTEAASRLGHANGSYLSQLTGPNPSREISEKVARKIESKLGLVAGYLDQKNQNVDSCPSDEGRKCVSGLTIALSTLVEVLDEVLRKQGRTENISSDKFGHLCAFLYEQNSKGNPISGTLIRSLVNIAIGK